MMTSGSWRTKARIAVAKVRPIAGLTWLWLTPGISYSTGSSMVRILREGWFKSDSMVASVVVLPLPVGPVMMIMPCGSCKQPGQHRFVGHGEAELARCRGGRDPAAAGGAPRTSPCWVGMVATRISMSERAMRRRAAPSCGSRRSAILRPARILMREISACGGASLGRGHGAQEPVDAHAHRQARCGTARCGCRWRAARRPFRAGR